MQRFEKQPVVAALAPRRFGAHNGTVVAAKG